MESFWKNEKYPVCSLMFFTNASILGYVKKTLGKLERIYLAALVRRKSRLCRQIAGGNMSGLSGSRATKYRELKRQKGALNGGEGEN